MNKFFSCFFFFKFYLLFTISSYAGAYTVDDARIDELFASAEDNQESNSLTASPLPLSPFHFRKFSGIAFGKPMATEGGDERVTAGVLGIFLGFLGVHRFYLGHTSAGITYLAFTLIGPVVGAIVFFATCGVGFPLYVPLFMSPLITWVIGIVDGAHYLSVDDKEFENLYRNDKSLIQW